jgi:hypothetical protein
MVCDTVGEESATRGPTNAGVIKHQHVYMQVGTDSDDGVDQITPSGKAAAIRNLSASGMNYFWTVQRLYERHPYGAPRLLYRTVQHVLNRYFEVCMRVNRT